LQGPYDALLAGAACTVPLPPQVKAPKKNVWSAITRQEQDDVGKFLHKQHFPNTTSVSAVGIDLVAPNKSEVCNHARGND
jgi:hypothetical protein